MLTLERKEGEILKIETPNGDILIRVSGIKDNRVKVSIDAPREFSISRPESHTKASPRMIQNDRKTLSLS